MDYLNYGKSKPQSLVENQTQKLEDSPPPEKQSKVLLLFPTPVCITPPYPDDYNLQLEWIKSLELRNNGYENNRTSVNSFVLDNPIMAEIRSFIEVELNNFALNILGYDRKFVITQSWINRNSKGEFHHLHAHPNSIISGVWYPQVGRETPPISFSTLHEKRIVIPPVEYNSCNGENQHVHANQGEMIMFPSYLKHSVPPNKSDEERISLSFNTWIRGSLGSKEHLTYLPQDV